jgi:23S rRNA (pseudouridine1915-N3)-methyltransferase
VRLSILWIGKTKDRRLASLIGEYMERIGRYCSLEVIEIREEPRDSKSEQQVRVEREGRKLLKALRPGVFRLALDERGREMTSEEFAKFLGRTLEGTPAGVTLILGGPYGLSEAVIKEAGHLWALSRMTLTHETARLVALDQVYRAFTILRGERYHH